jgi:hypothetical protein
MISKYCELGMGGTLKNYGFQNSEPLHAHAQQYKNLEKTASKAKFFMILLKN